MEEGSKITLKVLVDREKKRLVLAESDKDFVDILFSFFTLPMGTIIRLLGKPAELGCMSNLYASVENLSTQHLQTNACKVMLLWPRSEAADLCKDLKINIDDTKTSDFYVCSNCSSPCHYASVPDTTCDTCGKPSTNRRKTWNQSEKFDSVDRDGVFVKGGVSFMITDDLHVSEATARNSFALLDKLGIKDGRVLEEMILHLGPKEILLLLKRSLVSVRPLSDVCFYIAGVADSTDNIVIKKVIHPITEIEKTFTESKKISTMLLLDEVNNRVAFAEAGEELMNLLFSFLTFPLGFVIKILENNSSIGCVDNLYRSIQDLDIKYFKFYEVKSMLLSPKLAPFFGCDYQLLKVDEVPSYGGLRCPKNCYMRLDTTNSSSLDCKHGYLSKVEELNPKMEYASTQTRGRYARRIGLLLVKDNLFVSPLTPISVIQAANKLKVNNDKLSDREAGIGEIQALDMLRAALTSKNALTNVFCQK